jgi:hypothetical protein
MSSSLLRAFPKKNQRESKLVKKTHFRDYGKGILKNLRCDSRCYVDVSILGLPDALNAEIKTI